jgi:hypothetical protein
MGAPYLYMTLVAKGLRVIYIFYSYNLASLGVFVLSISEYRWAEENGVFIVGMSHIDT